MLGWIYFILLSVPYSWQPVWTIDLYYSGQHYNADWMIYDRVEIDYPPTYYSIGPDSDMVVLWGSKVTKFDSDSGNVLWEVDLDTVRFGSTTSWDILSFEMVAKFTFILLGHHRQRKFIVIDSLGNIIALDNYEFYSYTNRIDEVNESIFKVPTQYFGHYHDDDPLVYVIMGKDFSDYSNEYELDYLYFIPEEKGVSYNDIRFPDSIVPGDGIDYIMILPTREDYGYLLSLVSGSGEHTVLYYAKNLTDDYPHPPAVLDYYVVPGYYRLYWDYDVRTAFMRRYSSIIFTGYLRHHTYSFTYYHNGNFRNVIYTGDRAIRPAYPDPYYLNGTEYFFFSDNVVALVDLDNSPELEFMDTVPFHIKFADVYGYSGYHVFFVGRDDSSHPVLFKMGSHGGARILYKERRFSGSFVGGTYVKHDTSYILVYRNSDYGRDFKLIKLKYLPANDTIPPSIPQLVLPDSISTDSSILFVWRNSTDDLYGVRDYDLQISHDTAFSRIVIDTVISDTFITLSLGEGIYYWRVNASDSAGNTSDWSPFRKLYVDLSPPGVPDIIYPMDTIVGQYENGIRFIWHRVEDIMPVRYTMEVSLNSDTSGLVYTGEMIGDTVHVPLMDLITPTTGDTELYWRVEAIDIAGRGSGYSGWVSFRIDFEAPVVEWTEGEVANDSVVIRTSVTDNIGVGEVLSVYRIDGGEWDTVEMGSVDSVYEVGIGVGDSVRYVDYYIVCRDIGEPYNEVRDPFLAPYYYYTIVLGVEEGGVRGNWLRLRGGNIGKAIELEVEYEGEVEVKVYDVVGREVRRWSGRVMGDRVIRFEGLRAGLYVVRVRGSKGEKTIKVFVIK